MLLKRHIFACLALVGMSWSQYAMGGGPHHGELCAGQDGCVPQRVLWGYYPTIWRRWPTDRAGKPLKSAPELVPTPAKQPPASDQVVPPTTTPATPPTTEPGLNLPPTQPGSTPPGMTLPGDELPLPGDESTPQQRGPAETTEPPKEVAPPAQLAPPTELAPPDDLLEPSGGDEAMPSEKTRGEAKPKTAPTEEDPFKDEPPTSDDAPPAPPKGESQRVRNEIRTAARDTIRWRVIAKAEATPAPRSKVKQAVAQEPPRRLAPFKTQGSFDSDRFAIDKSNPLRGANPAVGDDRVVPAASWSNERADSSVARANPLRQQ